MKGPPQLVNQRSASAKRLVALGEVMRPHGVKGELRVKIYNPESEVELRGRTLTVRTRAGERPMRIVAARATPDAVLVRFEGVEGRTEADALRGAVLLVEREELPEPDEGEFYAADVEGARARLADGADVGVVERVASYPTCDVLVIATRAGERIEVPLTDAFVEPLDPRAGVVVLKTLDGIDVRR